MGRGSWGSDDWPDADESGSEWVRPLPRDDAPGRPGPSRFEPRGPDTYDEGGHDRRRDPGDDEAPAYAPEQPPPSGKYPQQFEPQYDYDRGFAGWGDRTEPGTRSSRGRGRGGGMGRGMGRTPRYREPSGGFLPEALPFLPTMGIALVAIILAFVLGRSTGGGDDTAATPKVDAAQSTTSVSSAPTTHTVQENDTLSGIASQYGVTSEALAAANNINNTNQVFVGQKLTIPASAAVNASTTTTRVPG